MTKYIWGPENKTIIPTPKPAFLMNEDDSGLCQMFRVGIPERELIEFCKQSAGPTKRFELFKYLMNALPYQVGNIKGYDNMFIATTERRFV